MHEIHLVTLWVACSTKPLKKNSIKARCISLTTNLFLSNYAPKIIEKTECSFSVLACPWARNTEMDQLELDLRSPPPHLPTRSLLLALNELLLASASLVSVSDTRIASFVPVMSTLHLTQIPDFFLQMQLQKPSITQ